MTARERYIGLLRYTPPIRYLSALSPSPVTENQKESIRRMQTELKDEVINAIIDYVMRKNTYRFSGSYAEKIGQTLGSKGITTVEDALKFFSAIARKERPKPKPEIDLSPEELEREVEELLADIEHVDMPLNFDWDRVATEEEKDFINSELFEKPWTDEKKKEVDHLIAVWNQRVIEGRRNGTL